MTAIAAKIINILIEIARIIGRSIVRRLANLGMKKGVAWMAKRIAVFERRLKRAIERGWRLRIAWLNGRISRWTWAIEKVRKHQKKLEDKAVRAYCKATGTALAKVPWYASAERCPSDVRAESSVGLQGIGV